MLFLRARQISGRRARDSRATPLPGTGGRVAPALLAALLVSACGPDGRQVRLCERIFAELEEGAARYVRVGAEALPEDMPGVALVYRRQDDAGTARFVCRFRGARFAPGQAELVAVTRLSGEPLSRFALQHLRRRVGLE